MITRDRVIDFALFCGIMFFFGSLVFGVAYGFRALSAGIDTRSPEDRETARLCQEWQFESQIEKYVDGPSIQKQCKYYLSHRSKEERQFDEANWKAQLDSARKDWQSGADDKQD